MYPLSTLCPVRGSTPVTWAIIALNAFIWLYQAGLTGADGDLFVAEYGAHPVLIVHGLWPLSDDSLRLLASLFTSQFLHADIFHVGLNMLFFHVFSRVVETLMGSWRFAIFYLLSGALGAFTHSLCNPNSMIPLIGASGAVAGVLGAHALLVPWDRVKVASRWSRTTTLPAYSFTALWVGLQFLVPLDEGSNVAWLGHIGGIAAGLALAPLFRSAGVPLFGRSEGDIEKSEESEEDKSENAEKDAAPPPLSDDDERPLPELRPSHLWSAVIAAGALSLFGWAWIGAAHAGDAPAQSRALEWRALAHLSGVQLRRGPARGIADYRDAAKLGDPDVQARFAELLARGAIGEAGRAEAWEWYARAAEGGSPKAMRVYATALIEGVSVKRDMRSALALLDRLGGAGYAWGNYMLGQVAELGLGDLAPDLNEAATRYEMACTSSGYGKDKREGVGPACYRLARLLHSKAVPREKPDAAKQFMRRAADEGDDDARNAYGLWLATGDPDSDDIAPGSSPDDERAARYFSYAAEAGHPDGMYNLARMIELNRAAQISHSTERMRALYTTSAERGSKKAKAALERLFPEPARKD